MLVPYKKDYEKVAMGLLSYLPDFKNLQNLQEEMQLYAADPAHRLYLYRDQEQNIVGLVGCEIGSGCQVLRYLSLAPGFRDDEHFTRLMQELKQESGKLKLLTVPEYTYLLKYLKNDER
ncbi:reductase [Lactobacillus nasalidis]|uniref:Reductase n=1 Tax=Lactobacillus nasalidis TaxID=2797258 RepID=A0ABQ3W4J1_9LACO|nr:reductase [Lactobacillus nasalidis]GHV99899.1 reductase [Lactobacillus nasalidis]GHW00432.1 reductase [Lactobacillus nasalidis]